MVLLHSGSVAFPALKTTPRPKPIQSLCPPYFASDSFVLAPGGYILREDGRIARVDP